MGQRSSKSNPSHDRVPPAVEDLSAGAPPKSILKIRKSRNATGTVRPHRFRFANTETNPNGTIKPLGTGITYRPKNKPSKLHQILRFENETTGKPLPTKKDGRNDLYDYNTVDPSVNTRHLPNNVNPRAALSYSRNNEMRFKENMKRQLQRRFPHGLTALRSNNVVKAALFDEGERDLTPFRPEPSYMPPYNRINKVRFPPQLARATVKKSITGGARKTRRRRHSRK